jgi:RNA-splicing ligase RtcB
MQLIDGTIAVFGEADEKTMKQIRTCAKTADKVALMPDNHLGYGVPIGGVVAYRNAISPTGVGYDIGCGNKAVRLDMTGADLRLNIDRIMDEISATELLRGFSKRQARKTAWTLSLAFWTSTVIWVRSIYWPCISLALMPMRAVTGFAIALQRSSGQKLWR